MMRLWKRGSTTGGDFPDWIVGLMFVVVGLLLLVVPTKCQKDKDVELEKEQVFIIDQQRDMLYFLMEEIGGKNLGDEIVLGEYDASMRESLKKRLSSRLGGVNAPDLEKKTVWATVKITHGDAEIYDDVPNVIVRNFEGVEKKVPLTMYLPSLDGSLITVETSVARATLYAPEDKNMVPS